jgi:hypothetical protein
MLAFSFTLMSYTGLGFVNVAWKQCAVASFSAYFFLWYAKDHTQQSGLSYTGFSHYQNSEATTLLREEVFIGVPIIRFYDWPVRHRNDVNCDQSAKISTSRRPVLLSE